MLNSTRRYYPEMPVTTSGGASSSVVFEVPVNVIHQRASIFREDCVPVSAIYKCEWCDGDVCVTSDNQV